jgi:CDP-4-dehydro-6-deoxyglucose reductase, E1
MTREELLLLIENYLQDNVDKKEFIPGVTQIPVSGAIVSDEDILSVIDTALDKWFTEGKKCAVFAKKLSEFFDKPYCLLTNSGSSASLVAMTVMARKAKKSRFVLTSALAFPTTIAPIYQNNLIPFFVDVNIKDLSPDLNQVEEVLNSTDIAGAIFTHTLGFPYKENKLYELFGDEKFIISDGCDAFGANVPVIHDDYVSYYPVGTFSDALTLSFFPAHQIFSSGEGGAVLFSNKEDYEVGRSLISWGRACRCKPGQDNVCGKRFSYTNQGTLPDGYDHKYIFERLGYNLKMIELQAAMGITQLNVVDEFIQKRKDNVVKLLHALSDSKYLKFINIIYLNSSSPFGFPIFVKQDAPFSANELISYLESVKIRTRRFFAGNIIRQPGFHSYPRMNKDLSTTDYIMNNGLWIGCYPGITDEMIDYMADKIKEFERRYK